MNPECPKCSTSSTRRRPRAKSFTHRLMFFLGMYPWECLTCQRRFFSSTRHSHARRHPQGEIYTGSQPASKVSQRAREIEGK